MKTIFRYTNISLLLAAIFAIGAIGTFAQDPCGDAAGLTALDAQVREKFTVKTIAGRKAFVEVGKQFVEKYGSCEPAKEFAEWLNKQIPANEKIIKDMEAAEEEARLVKRFDSALDAKNWDEVVAAGKEVLAKYPEKFRTVEIVLASLGGEEALKGNFKYSTEAIRFGKQSIADLESGKDFLIGGKEAIGLAKPNLYNFGYPNRQDAIGWINLYIGYIMQVDKKDKAGAAPYLYKATQANSESKKNPVSYGLIGYYYAEQGDKLADEIQALIKSQDPADTEEVAKQKIDAIKAKVALSNGTNQRAADAFSRAYSLSTNAAYKAEIKKALDFSYNRRFGKMEGLDAWVSNAVKQPFENPTTPVTPISDPDPVTTSTGQVSGVGAANGSGVSPAAKPATATVKKN